MTKTYIIKVRSWEMGYFDHVDDKIENIQEVGDIEKWAGISFWFSVGALGLLIHSIVLCAFLGWLNVYAGIPFFATFAFGIVGLVYATKSGKASSMIRQKNELNNMARIYNILWILIGLVCLAINTGFSIATMLGSI